MEGGDLRPPARVALKERSLKLQSQVLESLLVDDSEEDTAGELHSDSE